LKRTVTLIAVFLVLILLKVSLSQNNVGQFFETGVKYYKNKQYQEAQNTFFRALKNFPESRLQTAIKLMLAKSYYKLENHSLATVVVSDFIKRYEKSDYLDDIYFLRGKIAYRQDNFIGAIDSWMWIVYNGRDPRLKRKAGDYVFHTMDLKLSDNEVVELRREYTDDTFRGLVEILEAQNLIDSGKRDMGERRLRRFIQQNPYHIFTDMANEILRGTRGPTISSNRVLILNSGEEGNKTVSDDIAKGFYYAAYEMSQRDQSKVMDVDTLTVSEDILSTVKQVLSSLESDQPLAIVGPLEDDKNTTLALLSKYEFFPFISPLSSQKGLADLSYYTFQINPDAEIKGRFLADYAVNELDFKYFAILAPANAYGISMVNGFEETIEQNEPEIVETQWYYEDTQDFTRQLKAIRRKGFLIAFRDSLLGVDSTFTDQEIQEQFKQYMTETLFSTQGNRDIDSTQVPSTGIDALFIVTYPQFIPFIAPQFAFQNIQTTLLGNEGWNNKELLMQHQVYLDGLIYITAGYFETESWNYKAFQSRFRQVMQETPEVYHLLGYDIGKWMISHFRSGISRRDFRDALAGGELYQGFLENIHFGIKPRVNSELNVIRFYRGQLLKVK
jgi:ABC-type branched-subunit amino acid transport system substrate-binding protein